MKRLYTKFTVALISLFFTAQAYSYVEILESLSANVLKRNWTELRNTEIDSLKILVTYLEQSRTGKKILMKAKQKARGEGKSLYDILKVGNTSITDTTLLRRFSTDDPDKVELESRSIVYLNRDLSVLDGLLDLAHELTHYIYREGFNPYEKNFTAETFVRKTVEGKGGEAEAFVIECTVGQELFPGRLNDDCFRIRNKKGKWFSKELASLHFYRVGSYFKEFNGLLSQLEPSLDSLDYVTGESTTFISSAYGAPYPMAALSEYKTIKEKVCENDSNRIQVLKRRLGPAEFGRSDQYNTMIKDFFDRCGAL